MKKFILSTVLLCFSVSLCFAQNRKTPVKKIEPKPIQTQTIREISDADWKTLTDALQTENWKNSALLAAQYLQKLKTDNEKKQLARLRYFYLYSLAGKILAASSANISLDNNSMWKQLDEAVSGFTGKEIVLPPRGFMIECREVLNYICAVKDNERVLRVTTTNAAGTMIHSFDYVLFDEKIPVGEFAEKQLFLGGKLKKAEFNQDLSKPWVMRLIFEKGFARVVAPQ